jgi:Domain of unknown function (DUF3883)
MSKFFEINPLTKIGFKKLSDADLGTGTSHMTHIGLFGDTFEFVTDVHETASAKLIYQNTSIELVCLLDFIENPDGSFRSPKIREGKKDELNIDGQFINSVVREIRSIVKYSDPNSKWYLIWFGLNNKELVFYLIKEDSKDFAVIQNIIPLFKEKCERRGGRIENIDPIFNSVLKYLEIKIENSSTEFLQNLEIIAQTDEIPLKIIKPRFFDIERAKKAYAETGKKGEELIDIYLEKLKTGKQIANYSWVNKSRESGFPYDFEINPISGSVVYTDVKTTSYTFEQDMIFSKSELFFINQSPNYHIYRVFDLKEEKPSLRICEDLNTLSKNLVGNIVTFEKEILPNQAKLNALKLAIAPTNSFLSFNTKIVLE